MTSRLHEVSLRHDHAGGPPRERAAKPYRDAVVLVASDVVHAVRAARMAAARDVGRPIVLVVAHPGRPDESPTLHPSGRTLTPELAAVAGRARMVLRRAGLDHAVLSAPFVNTEDGSRRSRRITTALVDACRRLGAGKLVIDERAYWAPGTPSVVEGLRFAAGIGRLGRAKLIVTGAGPGPAIVSGTSASPVTLPARRVPVPPIPAARSAAEQPAAVC